MGAGPGPAFTRSRVALNGRTRGRTDTWYSSSTEAALPYLRRLSALRLSTTRIHHVDCFDHPAFRRQHDRYAQSPLEAAAPSLVAMDRCD
eukprot:gene14349-20344_t